jgi:hypothetical protein
MQKSKNQSALTVIPYYTEEATIGSFIISAKRHVNKVLVVDDGVTMIQQKSLKR